MAIVNWVHIMFKVGDKVVRTVPFDDTYNPKNSLKAGEKFFITQVNNTGSIKVKGKTRWYNAEKFKLLSTKDFTVKNPKNLPKE